MRGLGWIAASGLAAGLALAGCDTRRCRAPEGMGAPESIAEAVALLNALPRPVTVDCYLESLDRPLYVEATSSAFSAQPADGARSPRLLLTSGALVTTVAVDGPGAHLLEFGEQLGDARSVKGELALPVVAPLAEDAPYTHVLFGEEGELTTCAFCHASEAPSPDHPGGFVSEAIRPDPRGLVPLARLYDEARGCDPEREPARCARLDALLGHGVLRHQPLPESFPTFFE